MAKQVFYFCFERLFRRVGAKRMEYRVERIGGGCCRIWMHGQGGPAIYWGTAHEEEQVRQDTNVRASELVWHNGGHFTDVDQRIAQVFIWLIRARGKR